MQIQTEPASRSPGEASKGLPTGRGLGPPAKTNEGMSSHLICLQGATGYRLLSGKNERYVFHFFHKSHAKHIRAQLMNLQFVHFYFSVFQNLFHRNYNH